MADKAAALIIQFARTPVVGNVKTRMIPILSAEQACELHTQLVLWTAGQLCGADLAPVELWVGGEPQHPVIARCLSLGVKNIRQQQGETLGSRMSMALADGLQRFDKVVLVGSDCPSLGRGHLEQALKVLDDHTVVVGPANDGGYVLVGAALECPDIFSGMTWGHDQVFAETVTRLDALGVVWGQLESLPDVDRPEDLPACRAILERGR